jgi:glycosyltransferase 2 family protein
LASVIADKTTGVVSQVLALLIGLVAAAFVLPNSSALLLAAGAALALEILCVAGFIAAQLRGLIGGGGRLVARLRMSPGPERQAVLDGTDHALRSLYFERVGGLMVFASCHFLGFALGVIEIYLVVQFLGVPISPRAAFAIGALGTAVKFFSFMVPASLGALEGGNMAIFAAFGLGGTVGLTYTLVRRLREIVWIAAGFLATHFVWLPPVPPADRP